MTFSDLRLAEPIARAVASKGYTEPSPIQAQAIPPIMNGDDVLGCAQTGTGKTAAFALPILHELATYKPEDRQARGRPRALVIAPTRELATQIYESFRTYGRHLKLRHAVVFGGVSQFQQTRTLGQGVDVLVATPGRLLDLMNQGFIDLSRVEMLVLDEADHMLDMGFIRDIRRIMEQVPAQRQTLLFSATMPPEIRKLADDILYEPVTVKTAPDSTPAELIAQSVYMVDRKDKPELLERILNREGAGRTLVFSRTKHGANKLVKKLDDAGIRSEAIHGNKTQAARTRALNAFKKGATPVLIATDIAARGIDVDDVTHVINYDIPNVPETYVHRIGRTARAGASGVALSFCDREEIGDLRAVERLIGRAIEISEDEPDLVFKAAAPGASRPRKQGAGAQPSQGNSQNGPRRRGGKPRRPRPNKSQAGRRTTRAARNP